MTFTIKQKVKLAPGFYKGGNPAQRAKVDRRRGEVLEIDPYGNNKNLIRVDWAANNKPSFRAGIECIPSEFLADASEEAS